LLASMQCPRENIARILSKYPCSLTLLEQSEEA
jgi:hypothetical protein